MEEERSGDVNESVGFAGSIPHNPAHHVLVIATVVHVYQSAAMVNPLCCPEETVLPLIYKVWFFSVLL